VLDSSELEASDSESVKLPAHPHHNIHTLATASDEHKNTQLHGLKLCGEAVGGYVVKWLEAVWVSGWGLCGEVVGGCVVKWLEAMW